MQALGILFRLDISWGPRLSVSPEVGTVCSFFGKSLEGVIVRLLHSPQHSWRGTACQLGSALGILVCYTALVGYIWCIILDVFYSNK